MKIILALILINSLAACSLVPIHSKPNLQKSIEQNIALKNHLIYIDKNGSLIDPYSKKEISNVDEYINNIFTAYKKSNNKEITFFIHGGLNTFQNATNKANQILNNYDDNDRFIIVIGWDAGPFTNYLDHLFYIRKGERKRVIGPLTSPFILVEDITRSIGHAPRATTEAILDQSSISIGYRSKEEKAYDTNRANLELMPDDIRINIHTTGNPKGLKAKDLSTLVNPIKFVSAPFVDGFGHGTWNSLSRRTEILITKDTVFNSKRNRNTALEKILNLIDKDTTKPEITLIGHSMGTMVANNIIIRKPMLNYKNIVYMGAAATIKDVESNVVPILRQNKNVQFYNLSLDPYRELSESTAYDMVPRGSLLIWIDTYLTTVKSFTERTSGSWFNIVRAADTIFPDSVKKQVHLTKFGFDAGPQKHGKFDEYRFWKNAYWIGDEKCGLLLLDKPIDNNLEGECKNLEVKK